MRSNHLFRGTTAILAPAVLAGTALMASPAQGELMWDPVDQMTDGAQGGDGVWDNSTANFWDPDANGGDGANVVWDPDEAGTFREGNGNDTVTLGADITANQDIGFDRAAGPEEVVNSAGNSFSLTINGDGTNNDGDLILANQAHTFDVPIVLSGFVNIENQKGSNDANFNEPISTGAVTSTVQFFPTFRGSGADFFLNAANTYTHTTRVRNGSNFNLTGSLAQSNFDIRSGGVVQGVSGDAGILNYNLDGDTNDLIDNEGTINLSDLDLNVDATGSQTQSEYDIVSLDGGTYNGTFNSVTGEPAGYSVQYNPDGVVLTSIPEPASVALLGIGGMLMLGGPRRRRLQ